MFIYSSEKVYYHYDMNIFIFMNEIEPIFAHQHDYFNDFELSYINMYFHINI